ncbi:uncharacterized protein LOC118751774 [Rhagoletis pomonella]|uniref:uncharacterized protein LOC118751773 n=1 Tax=Rhagoletis pomonella TaxID=28610 RepID=UPI0017826187|nr:uncharacterized protein LOC118751773 [Rhagoletis pomonella]XP_036342485.1 uncharacterized protein LOC118751774 [Rhagoletis pomonella]
MTNRNILICFILSLLCYLQFGFAYAVTKRATATAARPNDASDHTVDLKHFVLARILAEADAASNFVIAPQELLALYLQLHGTDKEIADATAAATSIPAVVPTVAAHTDQIENGDLYNQRAYDAVSNDADTDITGDSGMKEYAEFFNIAGNPITVSNTLYADAYNAKRFTRKLKNLQFVLNEESDEDDDKNTSRNNASGKCRNIDINAAAVIRTSNNNNNNNNAADHHNNNNKTNSNCNELINAVRINSRWAHNFQKRDTHKRQFYMPQLHTHAYLNAMRKDDIFLYGELTQLNASALELSLQRQQLKMLIILPHARSGLPRLLQRLSANVTLLDELCGMSRDAEQPTGAADATGYQRQHFQPTLVRVLLPKFQFSQRTVLDGIFQQLLNVTANVDLHWPSAWQVTQVVHFAVSEDGIGELEPSMVLFWNAFSSLRTKPLMFCVDHPFMFIVHNREGIQLLGHLAQLHE